MADSQVAILARFPCSHAAPGRRVRGRGQMELHPQALLDQPGLAGRPDAVSGEPVVAAVYMYSIELHSFHWLF